MELHDWISSIISGVAVIVSILGYLKGQKALEIASQREVDRLWSMEATTTRSGDPAAYIKYKSAGPRVQFRKVTVIEPSGLRLQGYELGYEHGRVVRAIGDETGPRRVLTVGVDIDAKRVAAGTIATLLHMPQRPMWSSSASTSVRLAVEYENNDAKRKRHTIDVWAHDVPWGA